MEIIELSKLKKENKKLKKENKYLKSELDALYKEIIIDKGESYVIPKKIFFEIWNNKVSNNEK